MLTDGHAYRFVTKSGRALDVRLLSYDTITKRHMVLPLARPGAQPQSLRVSDFVSFRRIRQCTTRKSQPKKNARSTKLYILKTGANIYKMGCSDDVDKRMRSGRTWCPIMEKVATRNIPDEKAANWRMYEEKLKNMFHDARCPSGGTEVFRLKSNELDTAKMYLRTLKF